MKNFKLSLLHCPIHRIQVKRKNHRIALSVFTIGILIAHYYKPELETHIAVATNFLFMVEPVA